MARGLCAVCQRFFEKEHAGQVKCRPCNDKDEVDYGKVRAYLELHEGASFADVMTDTGVSYRSLERFIEERRVYIVNNKMLPT